MNLNTHLPICLPPIHDDGEFESGLSAEVKDIPLYKSGYLKASREARAGETSIAIDVPRHPPQTHALEALVSGLSSPSVDIPLRSSRNYMPIDQVKKQLPERRDQPIYPTQQQNQQQAPDIPSARKPDFDKFENMSEIRGHRRGMPISLQSPSTESPETASRTSERSSYQTNMTSLPPLQQKSIDGSDQMRPLDDAELDPGSFDLVAPAEIGSNQYSLETRSEQLFSTEHLQVIFNDPSLLLNFTAFLSAHRPASIPLLIYYLDAIKAAKAINYSNAIAEALEPINGFDFTKTTTSKTMNAHLEEKSKQAFGALVREDLPAFVTHTYIQTVSQSIQQRITGTLPPSLREASEGLAEVFCLTDPSRPDNPIVFSSEEFHRTTQYGLNYVIGRNCRFLQGPKTNPFSVRRFRDKVEAGVEHSEVFLNYRRDGSPFMNLLMTAPLCDSRGTIRYYIGAQVDVSGLVKDCADMESLNRLVAQSKEANVDTNTEYGKPAKDEFQELSEMLNLQELDTVRRWGGRMHKENQQLEGENTGQAANWSKPRVLITSGSPDGSKDFSMSRGSGKLSGVYENYLLIRPYPNLRILFASPSLRVPGILQSPFMSKIGGSDRVRSELTQALAEGRGVTAKVKWVSKHDPEGRNRWIHCTPLIGSNGAIGVWMVIIVEDEASISSNKRFRMAPPVDPKFGRTAPISHKDDGSLRDFLLGNGGRNGSRASVESRHGTEEPGSLYSLRIE